MSYLARQTHSMTFCVALLALKTGWLDIAGSLPQAANDCFKATISVGPLPGVGRKLPGDLREGHSAVCIGEGGHRCTERERP
jgi:hypothetical protein